MNQRFAILTLVAALSLGFYSVAGGQASGNAAASAVATINLQKILGSCDQQVALLAENTSKTTALLAEKKSRTDEVQRLQAQMDPLQPGSADWEKTLASLQQKTLELEVWGKMAEQNNQRSRFQQIAMLYQSINQGAASVAQEMGYDVVLQSIDLPADLTRIAPQQFDAILKTRKVIYTSPQVDITDAVLQRVNTAYANR
ncbi:MAG: OmpH family outer membrane protein [Algisphaera sp.]